VTFPSYFSLPKKPNVGSESEPFEAAGQTWRVVVYPGGNRKRGRVGFYLRWVAPDTDSTCDATFTLQLVGKQDQASEGGGGEEAWRQPLSNNTQAGGVRRFDLDVAAFSSGVRFVHPSKASLPNGKAPDFGTHLIDASRLLNKKAKEPLTAVNNSPSFLGGGVFGDALDVQVTVSVFGTARGRRGGQAGAQPLLQSSKKEKEGKDEGPLAQSSAFTGASGLFRRSSVSSLLRPGDLRSGAGVNGLHVGQVVVPVIAPGRPWAVAPAETTAIRSRRKRQQGGAEGEEEAGIGGGQLNGSSSSSSTPLAALARREQFRGVRQRMFAVGAYPGVEYRVMRIFFKKKRDSGGGGGRAAVVGHDAKKVVENGKENNETVGLRALSQEEEELEKSLFEEEAFYAGPGCVLEIRPIYPLVAALERSDWPVKVHEQDVPAFFSQGGYNVVAAVGSALTAVLGLSAAFVLSTFVFSLFFIPSRSMEPALLVGDVLLVDKLTPRLSSLAAAATVGSGSTAEGTSDGVWGNSVEGGGGGVGGRGGGGSEVGDVVLFAPPPKLVEMLERRKQGVATAAGDSDVAFSTRSSSSTSTLSSSASSAAAPMVRSSTLLVKRVVAVGGDMVALNARSGKVTVNGLAIAGRDQCQAEPLRLIQKFIAEGNNLKGDDSDDMETQSGGKESSSSSSSSGGSGGDGDGSFLAKTSRGSSSGDGVSRGESAVGGGGKKGVTVTGVVPAGRLFVMGDCSDVSVDSRVWGTLPAADVRGKPLLRVWPPARVGPVAPPPAPFE